MYFFTKGSAKEIITAYHNLIGKPTLPPFWSLGWQASSYNYKNQAKYQEVIDQYKANKIPLEGVHLDIPYLGNYADFSVNTTAFPTISTFADNLHAANQKLVVIVDAGLSADSVEGFWTKAADKGVLLKSTHNPQDNQGWLTQHVWPTKTVFLDFMNDVAAGVWMEGINSLFAKVNYDGLWLDMNEATGFCDGECPDGVIPNRTQSLINNLSSKF